ncbi:TonB-dependent receptor plug domain-containing protein [Roseivirga sp. E12]|uniref:TonB-dependent receptor n=1 Tax=Roseivirga sp. E12 TaxID=2819237 RepID=UPI001ABCBAE2|nr:TonB-dependent receptor plug domain-containing protein [Roseivirga sp. E12]MBO3698224.1 TonB-dependent receptor plug domain-containing protein [Roseivirga sp. E12]
MTRFALMLVLALCCTTKSIAQSIRLDYQDELLNEILLDLNDRFDVQVSINSKLSNACSITINQSFQTIDLALDALAAKCRLEVVRIGDVYSFRVFEEAEPKPIEYLFQGRAVEQGSDEPLPFAVLYTSERSLVTDENGRFSFKSLASEENIKLRSLGYYEADTLLSHGEVLQISLLPRVTALDEIVVTGDRGSAPVTNIGEKSGYIQLNDVGNNLVAGLSNNLIFNNLRQYPGITAAGESIADFVIWGSYAGQNHVIYDGVSLFNSWGINDDMGRVNPYMIKHVEVYKGGYNVPYGDRVGGVVMIDGKSGNTNQLELGGSLTNQLVNAYVNVPLFKGSSSFQVAGRKTLTQELALASDNFDEDTSLIVPRYSYSDLHFKFSSSLSPSDQLEISSVISTDSYKGTLRTRSTRLQLFQDIKVKSEQIGGSLKYLKNWPKGGLSSVVLSTSRYTPKLGTNYFINRNVLAPVVDLRADNWSNPIVENRGRITHTFAAAKAHQLQVNLEHVDNEASFKTNEGDSLFAASVEQLIRVSLYAHDQIQLGQGFTLQLGLKAELPSQGNNVYWQPRVNGQFDLSEKWNAHFGWGHYNQFISRNSVIDELGNRADVWQVSNGNTIPILESVHNVLGLGFRDKGFEVSLEGFVKTTSGFTRYFFDRRGTVVIGEGESKAKGIDLFVRKHINDHVIWLSYSLSKVEERFGNGGRVSQYRPAPQNQRHELKATAIFDLSPFELSVTNVYGSGFSDNTFVRNMEDFKPYWRTDLAFQYRYQLANTNVEAGISFLNLFNSRNIRLNQSVSVPDGNVINTVGVPFTPTVFLNFDIK